MSIHDEIGGDPLKKKIAISPEEVQRSMDKLLVQENGVRVQLLDKITHEK